MSNILIIDYKVNNLKSIYYAILKLGYTPQISNNSHDIKKASKIILPGVGSFGSAMKNLEESGWKDKLSSFINKYNIPTMGICLGMQILAETSNEGKLQEGLGLISGDVRKLESQKLNEKIPHVGWNQVVIEKDSVLFNKIPNNSDFYFTHSFHFIPTNESDVIAHTPYCEKFISVIQKQHIYGVQFHPEKSSLHGLQLLKNFLEIE